MLEVEVFSREDVAEVVEEMEGGEVVPTLIDLRTLEMAIEFVSLTMGFGLVQAVLLSTVTTVNAATSTFAAVATRRLVGRRFIKQYIVLTQSW